MTDVSALRSSPGMTLEPLASRANQILRSPASAGTEDRKIEKSAKDFESILLGSWLQQAEQSFGSLPGGDDEDSGKDQFQGMAMQQLGTSMTAAGGIGIAKMISTQLHKSESAQFVQTPKGGHAESK